MAQWEMDGGVGASRVPLAWLAWLREKRGAPVVAIACVGRRALARRPAGVVDVAVVGGAGPFERLGALVRLALEAGRELVEGI